jgi:UrcA family protein
MYGKIKLPIVVAGLATASAGFAVPAMAEPAFSTASVTVDYRGVDLTSQKGRETLDRRVNAAISAMCGQAIFGTREEAEALQQCRIEARTAVEPQLQAAKTRATTNVASVR